LKLLPRAGWVAASVRTTGETFLLSPATISEFTAMAATAKRPVAVVAGGTDICAQYNDGAAFASLIDISGIRELHTVAAHDGSLLIGSGLALFDAAHHPLLVEALPGIAAAFRQIANVRIRFRATLGGNIMARRPRYEVATLALAARATLRFREAGGVRVQSMEDFLCSPAPIDCLLECLAMPAEGWLDFHYDRSLRPAMTLCFSAIRSVRRIAARAVIATEYRWPVALDVDLGEGLTSRSEVDAIARHAFCALPDDFADAVSSNWYLRRAGAALLARRLRVLANG